MVTHPFFSSSSSDKLYFPQQRYYYNQNHYYLDLLYEHISLVEAGMPNNLYNGIYCVIFQ